MLSIFWYSLIPCVITLIGGALSTYWTPKDKGASILQHFVAGVVISAVASDLMPKLFESGSVFTVTVGFVLGVIVMLAIHAFAHYVADHFQSATLPLGLIFAAAIDLLIDGLLIGLAFAGGLSSGILIALSLSLCGFFLNLSIGTRLSQASTVTKWGSVIFVAIMLPIGAIIGATIVETMPASLMLETIAFGVAAILFLGCEELLGPAHRKHHSSTASAALFLGFLLVLLLKL